MKIFFKASLKRVNTWMVFIVLLAVLCLLVFLRNPQLFPVTVVKVDGNYWHVSEQDIIKLVDPEIKKGFFKANLAKIQSDLKYNLPWIDKVSVTRVWPRVYEISISQKQPMATWNNNALIDKDFSLFYPLAPTFPQDLPVFEGNTTQEKIVAQDYQVMMSDLKEMSFAIATIKVSSDGNWEVTFDNEGVVMLGNRDILGRFKRFVAIYEQLVDEKQKTPAYIDMRYSHGVAVKWALTEEKQDYVKAKSQ